MKWGLLISFFLFSTIKFMFTPLGGPKLGLLFWETYFSCVAGGILGAAFFYFSSGYFMKKSLEKKVMLREKAIAEGHPLPYKKKFTRMNKFVVKIKRSLGLFGTAMWVPFFLSVPIGSIVTAKFYRHEKKTFPIIVLGMFVNGIITTGFAYLIM